MVISKSVSQREECDAESQVKLSALSALRYSLRTKDTTMMQLQASIDIEEAEVAKLRAYLNTTLEEAETLITAIHNKTTPDIRELEITCEGAIATDCCEVSLDRTSVSCEYCLWEMLFSELFIIIIFIFFRFHL